VVVVAALVLASCGSSGGSPQDSPGRPVSTPGTSGTGATSATDGLTATLAQNREDEVKGVAVVRLTNHGDATVHVSSLSLAWAGLAPAEPTTPDYSLAPGVPTDLPVALGAATCARTADGAPDPATSPPTDPPAAAVTVDGTTTVVVMDVEDSRALAARLFARSCQQQAVASAVDVQFGPTWHPTTVDGTPAQAGSIVVRRRVSTATITITALEGSVLLDFAPTSPRVLPKWLAPSTKAAVIPVTLRTSGRCDGHALGESKKTYVLTALVDIGDGTARPVTVLPAEADRPVIWRTILDGCGITSPP
jgi:hypothetical protein